LPTAYNLIYDLRSSHLAASVKSLAEDLNIEIDYIPAGATGVLQPLDRWLWRADLRPDDNPGFQ
jgi:hypothetical protein